MTPTLYYDGRTPYLELHALRAPVGRYLAEYVNDSDLGEWATGEALREFQRTHGIELFCLGRSGRHICIEDTPTNRRRYPSLKKKAEAAADRLWASMRPPS